MLDDLPAAAARLASVVVFRGVKNGPVLRALRAFFECEGDESERVEKYADFVAALYERGYDLSRYLLDAAAEDENAYVLLRSRGEPVPAPLAQAVAGELGVFQELSDLTAGDFKRLMGYDGYLPGFESEKLDFAGEFEKRIARVNVTGYGQYARHTMFRVVDGQVVPVHTPDRTRIDELIGYERERQQLLDNTEALLRGLPAANTLLIGDAGTGKSSSIKATANLLAPRGLRLIEVPKAELLSIPAVMEHLRDNPLKFILFIDDLSFEKNDDTFSAMKAILEGSVSVKAPNTVIYATSNRRHLVKESFSDREGDDVHRGDTIQDTVALSDRFGLTILFTRPPKALYLRIVHELCAAKGIPVDEGLDVRACAFALRRGGMTPRAAEQFTDSILADIPRKKGEV